MTNSFWPAPHWYGPTWADLVEKIVDTGLISGFLFANAGRIQLSERETES